MERTHLLIPNLERLAADAVKNGQEAGLEAVLEHAAVGVRNCKR
jgi:hypothetical protein